MLEDRISGLGLTVARLVDYIAAIEKRLDELETTVGDKDTFLQSLVDLPLSGSLINNSPTQTAGSRLRALDAANNPVDPPLMTKGDPDWPTTEMIQAGYDKCNDFNIVLSAVGVREIFLAMWIARDK